MKDLFFPDRRVKSAYEIDYRGLYEEGIRGLIFDIDNTLVNPNAPADDRAKKLFARLRDMGFQTVILSNNTTRPERVPVFLQRMSEARL